MHTCSTENSNDNLQNKIMQILCWDLALGNHLMVLTDGKLCCDQGIEHIQA